jgi:hypothetical protein
VAVRCSWLDPGDEGCGSGVRTVESLRARLMRTYPVSTRINHAANDDEECCRPVEGAEVQAGLFS